ncbi:MAG: hypothetical protein J6D20_08710, partial [Clostridia bacterium]|nr:hypothetical protein [Clostridia bacterium]
MFESVGLPASENEQISRNVRKSLIFEVAAADDTVNFTEREINCTWIIIYMFESVGSPASENEQISRNVRKSLIFEVAAADDTVNFTEQEINCTWITIYKLNRKSPLKRCVFRGFFS